MFSVDFDVIYEQTFDLTNIRKPKDIDSVSWKEKNKWEWAYYMVRSNFGEPFELDEVGPMIDSMEGENAQSMIRRCYKQWTIGRNGKSIPCLYMMELSYLNSVLTMRVYSGEFLETNVEDKYFEGYW